MGSVDSEMSDLPLYALPIAVVLAVAAIPQGITRGKRSREWFGFMHRAPGDARPGPGHFEVETIGSEATNLGHSSEGGKTPSGTPTLVTEPVVLQIVGGPRVRLAACAKLVVVGLPGANRRTVETTTTQTGITNKISFDVPPGTRFWMRFALGQGGQGGYRDDTILEATPLDEYFVTTKMPAAPGVLSSAITYGIVFAIAGTVLGLMATMIWRTGCRSGRFPVPLAAFVDALGIGTILSMVGAHVGVNGVLPDVAMKMTKQPDGTFVMKVP